MNSPTCRQVVQHPSAAGLARLTLIVVGLVAAWIGWVGAAQAQAPVLVVVDSPADGSEAGPELAVRGWAHSPAGSGARVDAVEVYLDGPAGGAGRFLGTAAYGLPRPDVAASLGIAGSEAVGYELRAVLPPGEHSLYVYARVSTSPEDSSWSAPTQIMVSVPAARAAPERLAAAPSRPSQASPSSAVPPSAVAGGAVCHSRAPSGQCLAYTVASGGGGVACQELDAQGDCLAHAPSYSVSTACARYGTGGVCLAYNTPPAVNSSPGGAVQSSVPCLEWNAAGQCTRYANSATPEATALVLNAQVSGGMTALSWGTIRAATVYEVLRCSTPELASCSAVARSSATSYLLPQAQNFYYAVRALGADGQVLAISNLLGRL